MAVQAVQQVVLTYPPSPAHQARMAGAEGAIPAPQRRGAETEAPGLTETPLLATKVVRGSKGLPLLR